MSKKGKHFFILAIDKVVCYNFNVGEIMEIYEGTKPYLFISYAHKNSKEVEPIIKLLSESGFRVWYDSGLEVGTEWPAYISSHLKNSEVMLAFISNEYVNSKNCRNEVNLAMNKNKTVLAVYLNENVELTGGMDLQLASVHCIFKTRHNSNESLVEELSKSKMLANCKSNDDNSNVIKVSEPLKNSNDNFDFTYENGSITVSLKKGVIPPDVLVIPSNTNDLKPVTKIADNGFKNLNSVYYVYIEEGITEIGENAFSGCSNLNTVYFPTTLKSIDDTAFYNCINLSEIQPLPHGLENIGKGCFAGTNVLDLELPMTLETLGYGAFSNTPIKNVTLHELSGYVETLFENNSKTYPNPFANCDNLQSITIETSLAKGKIKYKYDKTTKTLIVSGASKSLNKLINCFSKDTQTIIFLSHIPTLNNLEINNFPNLKNLVGDYGVALKFKTLNNVNMFITKSYGIVVNDTKIQGFKKIYRHTEWEYINGVPKPKI